MKRPVLSAALVTLTALIAACGGGGTKPLPQPTDPTTVAPAAPVSGQALDLATAPTKAQDAAVTLDSMIQVNSDMDPDLAALLSTLGIPSQVQPTALRSPAALGQQVLRALNAARTPQGPLGAQVLTPVIDQPMTTGTQTIAADGSVTYATEPTDAWVVDNQQRGFVQRTEWHVNGAPSVWVEQETPSGLLRTEVPTHARGTITRAGTVAAQATLTMTPGPCLSKAGPTALNASGWAGKQAAPAAKTDVAYAWTDAGVKLSVSAELRTKTRAARAALDIDVRGTTADRCTPESVAFTPTAADLSASVTVPSHQADVKVALRDLGNVVVSADAMRAQNPFQDIRGRVNATATYNGQVAATAFGPLADGPDANLQPGDQVAVKYVHNGVLVETTLAALLSPPQP